MPELQQPYLNGNWKQEVTLRRGNIPEEKSPAVRYLRVRSLGAGDGECGNPRERDGKREGAKEEGEEGWEEGDPRVGTSRGKVLL